jgi:beta-xylosidase
MSSAFNQTTGAQTASGLINPILPGWNPDPTIIRVGEDYFIATSTFETYPGHPIWHSKNLADWNLLGYALNRPSQLPLMGTPSGGGA